MKSLASFFVVAIILLCGLGWVVYPTTFEAELRTYRTISDDDFSLVRKEAMDLSRATATKGIEIVAREPGSPSFGFYCKGVPLLFVDNSSILMTMSIMAGADARAPDVMHFRSQLEARLQPSGAPLDPRPALDQFGLLNSIVLKYRDGIDVAQQCK